MIENGQADVWHQIMKAAFGAADYAELKQATQEVWKMREEAMAMEEQINLRALLTALAEPTQVHPGYVAEYLAGYFVKIDPTFAEETLCMGVALTMQMFGDRSFDAARKIVSLGHFLSNVGKTTEALQMLQVGILLLQECNTQGVNNYSIPRESIFLADLYRSLGDDGNFELLLAKVIRWYEQLLQNTQREELVYTTLQRLLADAQLKLADHFLERTNPAALDLYTTLREHWMASEGVTIRQPMCYNRMGIVYEKMQFWPEAIACYTQARELIVALFGASHGDIPWCDARLQHCRQQSL